MSIIKEFKEFVVKGNVIDMAVGVIVGTAFGKIVTSLVADVVMPPIGVLLGGVNFSNLSITVKAAAGTAPAVVIAYGKFTQTVIDFLVISAVIFMGLRIISRLKSKMNPPLPPVVAPLSKDQELLSEIRDLLKK